MSRGEHLPITRNSNLDDMISVIDFLFYVKHILYDSLLYFLIESACVFYIVYTFISVRISLITYILKTKVAVLEISVKNVSAIDVLAIIAGAIEHMNTVTVE